MFIAFNVLKMAGIKSKVEGNPLLHDVAYYTLWHLPKGLTPDIRVKKYRQILETFRLEVSFNPAMINPN